MTISADWIDFESCGKAIVVTLAKQLPNAETDSRKINETLEEMVKSDHLHLVVDITAVKMLPPPVLKKFELLTIRLRNEGRKFALCGVQDRILYLFAQLRLDQAFLIFKDRKEALDALKK